MRKLIFAVGALALIVVACSKNNERLSDSIADLTQEYQEATNFNDSLLLLMGDIYTGLDSINMQEGLLYSLEPGETTGRREEIRNNLSAIKSRLEANRQLLVELEAKAKAAGEDNVVLTRTIAQLKQHIAQQDAKINDLENRLSSANQEISELHNTVAEKEEQVQTESAARAEAEQEAREANQQRVVAETAANTVYYAVGTSSELKKNGLNDPKKAYTNPAYFTKADKRYLTAIPLYTKKDPKFKSRQPAASSYSIVNNADGTKTLQIVNPDEFWRYSEYLVIEVKK